MTRFTFTAISPIRTRKDGEVAFAHIEIAGRSIRIQTQASNVDRPIFTVEGDEIIAHNDAAIALVTVEDEGAATLKRVMENVRRNEAQDIAAQMTDIMESEGATDEARLRAEIVRAHADRIAADMITDQVIADYVAHGDEAASIALGFGALIATAAEAQDLEAAWKIAVHGYMPRATLTDEEAEKYAAERIAYARNALPLMERARASWCALTGRPMRMHANPVSSLVMEVI